MKTIESGDLEDLVSICRGVANALAEGGRRLKAAAVHELCDVAADQHRAEQERVDGPPVGPEIVQTKDRVLSPAKETHRHVWGEGLYEGKCVAVVGCEAKPRKKKEAPAAEGGSQP